MSTLLELYEKWNQLKNEYYRHEYNDDAIIVENQMHELLVFARKKCEPEIKDLMKIHAGNVTFEILEKEWIKIEYNITRMDIELYHTDALFFEFWPLARVSNGRDEWLRSIK